MTIGTFDGIHPGHQALIDTLLAHGRRLARPAMMLTFEPMPREYLARGQPAGAAHVVARALAGAERTGLSHVLQLRFDEKLRNITGEEFAGCWRRS